MNKIIIIVSLFVFLISSNALAEDAKQKRATVNFEDELIKGDVNKPQLMYLLRQKQFNYKKLIKLRENFLPEMRSTAENLQQGR